MAENPTIDKDLFLVTELERRDGVKFYVHTAPLPSSVFKTYYRVISKAFAVIWGEGLGMISAPRVANLLLEELGKAAGLWGRSETDIGLQAQIRHLSWLLQPNTATGRWDMLPLHNAIAQGILDEEDAAEVEGAIAFFICAYSMHTRAQRAAILRTAVQIWGGQILSSNLTDFHASLPMWTAAENSGEPAVSSVPR